MGFFAAVLSCLGKYARFSGRASRSEYWNFVLFIVVVSVAMALVDKMLLGEDVVIRIEGATFRTNGPLFSLFALLVLLPLMAAGWRRLHDTGRSGIYLLYPLIVMLGVTTFWGYLTGFGPVLFGGDMEYFGWLVAIVVLVAFFVLAVSPMIVVWWLTRPSQSGDNAYGGQPVGRNSR